MSTIKESANKGIPSQVAINIRYTDLLSVTNNNKKLVKIIDNEFDKILKEVIFNNTDTSLGLQMLKTMQLKLKDNSIERGVFFSDSILIASLIINLNYNNICKENIKDASACYVFDKEEIKDVLEELKHETYNLIEVDTEKKLQRKYPYLYKTYKDFCTYEQSSLKVYQIYQDCLKNNPRKALLIRKEFAIKYPNIDPKIVFDYPIYMDVRNFSKKIALIIQDIIDRYDEITKEISKREIDISNLNGLDKDKLELYFAYMFLVNSIEHEDKQDYMYYVSNYIASIKDRIDEDISIKVDTIDDSVFFNLTETEGRIITPRMVYEIYRNILVDNPELKDINFSSDMFEGKNMDEIETFIKGYLQDIKVNWEIMPPGELELDGDTVCSKKPTYTPSEEAQKELFMRKKQFYDSSNPIVRVKGKNNFDGYIGFLYPNGLIALDRFYKNSKTKTLATDQAAYIMDYKDFYILSKYPKMTIIKEHLCPRIVHNGKWEERERKLLERK